MRNVHPRLRKDLERPNTQLTGAVTSTTWRHGHLAVPLSWGKRPLDRRLCVARFHGFCLFQIDAPDSVDWWSSVPGEHPHLIGSGPVSTGGTR